VEAEPLWVSGNQDPATVTEGLAKYEVPAPSTVMVWETKAFNTDSPWDCAYETSTYPSGLVIVD